ncbi:hypothetical protein N8987_06385 [Crocinitomix sp.]|nr:hypothetical protein [Crocinitomix sp.]
MDFKKFSFSCPSCSHILNDKDEIELLTKRKTGGGRKNLNVRCFR